MHSGNPPIITNFAESNFMQEQASLLNISRDLDGETLDEATTNAISKNIAESNTIAGTRVTDSANPKEFYEAFTNVYADKPKDEAYFKRKLELYRKEAFIVYAANLVFDFKISDADKYNILLETSKNGIKLIWQFIYLSYQNQELLMLDQRYKHYADTFDRINKFQRNGGRIAKADSSKVCKLFQNFQFFVLKNSVLKNSGRRQPSEKVKETPPTNTNLPEVVSMDVVSDFKLPKYTETEKLMDDVSF